MTKAKVAVILSGCGHRDGSEISESVMTLLALRLKGFEPVLFAPQRAQSDVMNHLNGELVLGPSREVLVESARIARGAVESLAKIEVSDFVALAIPGGLGVAKNLSSFASQGAQASVEMSVAETIKAFMAKGLPIMAVCIAPVLVGLVAARAKRSIKLTLGGAGSDSSSPAHLAMESLGHNVVKAEAHECVVDSDNRFVSTPAYMNSITLDEAWPGIQKAVDQLSKWTLGT